MFKTSKIITFSIILMSKLLNCNKQLCIYKQVYKIFVYQINSKIKVWSRQGKIWSPLKVVQRSLCLIGHRFSFRQAFTVFNFKVSYYYQFPRLKMMLCWVFYWLIPVLPSVSVTGSLKQYLYSSAGSKALSPSNISDFMSVNGKK